MKLSKKDVKRINIENLKEYYKHEYICKVCGLSYGSDTKEKRHICPLHSKKGRKKKTN